ncbi:Eco57I restriction-modification methylase domain-containing protein [Empedobacter sp. GD03797]|uniref:Eco57I restriction-modification methylase domain-containing protein n=1 Tax=Empedobacter sp. GD03797 TaxID=2975382 RepID=UPI0024478315|nr:TaqI-like C-terminal specificity domain-containing protein [Empedobacter sp. GD03797]MDH1884124.1 N-6 DNA methylase [Empedobacter sp. GD03797]
MILDKFSKNIVSGTLDLFKQLNVPINILTETPINPTDFFESNPNREVFKAIQNLYTIGLIDDDAINNQDSISINKIDEKYNGLIIVAVDLKADKISRTTFAEITRAISREFKNLPVITIFKYGHQIALASAERMPYKKSYLEGEKLGKVSILRDIDFNQPHAGHLRILNDLVIGKKANLDTFDKLYKFWTDNFNVSILNKKFYKELSNWYFWAIKEVKFPSEPTLEDAVTLSKDYDDLVNEHKATNVIRLLTRLLFVWFIKEKKLIPEELFDIKFLQQDLLHKIDPLKPVGMFVEQDKESIYYKAILQNLFFATLNCPKEADEYDKRFRAFRSSSSNFGVTHLMRYENYFKNKELFLKMVNDTVPFLNGGLFECLDVRGEKESKVERIYIDGFSDNLPKEQKLIVPDYLFFGNEITVDLSEEYGAKSKEFKESKAKGLFEILKSYKFTITENTPLEEEVELDPELLGRVFENLLASYNPETKSTARKQTGSFYTPREIVNYMVDESLIAYLKNNCSNWNNLSEEEIDTQLHQLFAFDAYNPFKENRELTTEIIKSLGACKILDPACGSGAFPMGTLQKMVHVLSKLDPDNTIWKELQIKKAQQQAEEVFKIDNNEIREDLLKEINHNFDEKINDPDYARKLYIIENSIYGVDIQPIAAQISKLRFFISLVVEQKVHKELPNFGIKPLPNLETKFVTANTLVDIENSDKQTNLFETETIIELKAKLKAVRNKIFNARTPETKKKYKEEDQTIRWQIAEELKNIGYPATDADALASWDPYNQNACSPFFNPEWMFDIKEGFDVVIGNPPYVTYKGKERVHITDNEFEYLLKKYKNTAEYKVNSYALFIENAVNLLKFNGVNSFIIPSTILQNEYLKNSRKFILEKNHIDLIVIFKNSIFEAVTDSIILNIKKNKQLYDTKVLKKSDCNFYNNIYEIWNKKEWLNNSDYVINVKLNELDKKIISDIELDSYQLGDVLNVYVGIVASGIKKFFSDSKKDINHRKYLLGKDIGQYSINWSNRFINYLPEELHSNTDENVYLSKYKILVRKTGNKLLAFIDKNQFFTDQSIYNVYKSDNSFNYIDFVYITCIINSSLMNYYFNKKLITNEDVFPYIKGIHLKSLPIKMNRDFYWSLFILGELNIYLNGNKYKDYIDFLILEIYLNRNIEIVNLDIKEFIEKDLIEVLGSKDFAIMSDEDKYKVIKSLDKKWCDPNNEVVKRIAQFKEKSPDILKVIMES